MYYSEYFYALFMQRLSKLCCLAISELLLLSKSVLSTSPKTQSDKVMEYSLKIEWLDDYILKAKFIKSKSQAMTDDIEVISNSFTIGM